MNEKVNHTVNHRFTLQIIIGIIAGIIVGLILKWLPLSEFARQIIVDDILKTGGDLFIRLLKMLVAPIVLVSLICGSSSLGDFRKLGRVGGKTLLLYLLTTAIAITLAIACASLFQIGKGINLSLAQTSVPQMKMSLKEVFLNIIPSNPFQALTQGNMLQIIVFALLFGIAISVSGDYGKKVASFFVSVNEVLMKLIIMIMKTAPYGVFFLLSSLFAQIGFRLIGYLIGYFLVVLLVLMLQLFGVYTFFLQFIGRLNPITFFRKMYSTMLFAFSVSSSNASIPVVLRTVEYRLGVDNSIASFIVPLGSTINMDGTAIMQGVATVFIAHAYHVSIGLAGYLTVVLLATLASIGTAGVPSVGLITLAMVLQQVGLPVEGIALIIGIDRLLDMVRTAVNISGDSMIACLVGKSEKAFDSETYYKVE